MGSRIRQGKHHLFELLVEVTRSVKNDSDRSINVCFPSDHNNQELLNSISKFAFPVSSNFSSPSSVDHFTFALTDIDGKFQFGFCRLSTRTDTCLCFISYYPWFDVFYRLLNFVAEVLLCNNDATAFLRSLHDLDVSIPGTTLRAKSTDEESFSFVIPDPTCLPSIPDNRNLTEYYNAIDSYNMMIIFASMLFERRILVVSRRLSRLTACVHGASSLFHPLQWQQIYIPVLPPHLVDYCTAPMPYLIGIHSSLFSTISKEDLGDVVLLDADNNSVRSNSDDLSLMPSKVVSLLKKELKAHKKNKPAHPCVLTGQTVARAFLQALVYLLGGYRYALVENNGKLSFDPGVFVHSRSPSMQPFLESLLQNQAFEQFINERIQLLEEDRYFTDNFEQQVKESGIFEKQEKNKDKQLMWQKYDKAFTEIATIVKSTSVNTFKMVKTTLHDIRGVDLAGSRRRNMDTNIEIVVTPATNKDFIDSSTVPPGKSLITRESKLRSESLRETNRRRSFRLSTDDSDVMEMMIHNSIAPLLSDVDIEKVFRKYSCDNLLDSKDSLVTLSDESNYSREYLSHGSEYLRKYFRVDEASGELRISVLERRETNLTNSSPNLTEPCNDSGSTMRVKGGESKSKKNDKAINRFGVHDSSGLVRNSSLSSSADNIASSTDFNTLSDRAPNIDSTANKNNENLNRKDSKWKRLSVRHLPNVKQIVQLFETPSPPSGTQPTPKIIPRYQPSDSIDSLVAQRAARYMTLDHGSRLGCP